MQPMLPSLQDAPGRDMGAQLHALQELAFRLNRLTDQQQILESAVAWAGQLGLGVAALGMQPGDAAFQLRTTAALSQPAIDTLWSLRFAPDDGCIAWEAARRGHTILANELPGGEQCTELRALARDTAFSAALAIPLMAGTGCLGVLLFFAASPEELRPSTTLLELLGRQVALVLEHGRIAADLRMREATIEQREATIEQRHANLRRAYDLVASERRTLAAVLDSASDAVLVIDIQGMVQLGNPAVEQAIGIHPDLLIGHLLHHTDVPEPLITLAQQARARRGQQEGELALSDGRVFHVSITPIQTFDGPVQGYVMLLKDVTYFKRLDEMKSQFVATVSHDLKSPLNIINGYIELLELEGPLNPEQSGYVSRVKRSVRRLMALVTNLLDLGRIEAGVGVQMGVCDIEAIVQTAVDNYRLVADEKKINLAIQQQPNLPPVWGDESRLRQVVDNLLSNALTYTPRGGTIRLLAEVANREVILRVQDNGIGISPPDLPHIFDPFFRSGAAKNVHMDGTGLGLAIVKRIVEEHSGAIGVESTAGSGSTFWFSLPSANR